MHSGLFGFVRKTSAVTTGKLKTPSFTPDPEDLKGARGLLAGIYNVFHPFRRKKIISYVEWLESVDLSDTIVSIGGPVSNPLTSELYYRPIEAKRPSQQLYFYIDPNPQGRARIMRKFDGRIYKRPLRQIIDVEEDETYSPSIKKDWLEEDFLLVTVKPNSLSEAREPDRVHAMFAGLYGPSVMAIEMLMKNKSILRKMNDGRHRCPYYQSLLKVVQIDHGKEFSEGNDIEHVATYPLWNLTI